MAKDEHLYGEIVDAVSRIIRSRPRVTVEEQHAAFQRWFRNQREDEHERLTDAVLNVVFEKVREGLTVDEDD